MKLSDNFNNSKGLGVLATANAEGKVNIAIYDRPHFLNKNDDTMVVFVGGLLKHYEHKAA